MSTIPTGAARVLLHQYSEWLDTSPLYADTGAHGPTATHDDLVAAFLEQRNPDALPRLTDVGEAS